MTYGNNKIRDMARSILPSSADHVTRDLAQVRRKGRRKINEKLNALRGPSSLAYDVHDEGREDFTWYPDREIIELMWERRGADNVGAICHWADRITADIEDPEDRYRYVERVLGTNTMQARHALSHVAWTLDYQPDPFYRSYRSPQIPRDLVGEYLTLIECLEFICGTKIHPEVNRKLKAPCGKWLNVVGTGRYENNRFVYDRYYKPCDHCRPLEGLHDVEAFARLLNYRWEIIGCGKDIRAIIAAAGMRTGVEVPLRFRQ